MDEPFYLDLAVQRVWAGPKIGEQLIRRAADADTVAA
jgi:predicted N-acetyltransferase YhbS